MRMPVSMGRGFGRAALQPVIRSQRSNGVPVMVPSGGWDADSPLAGMKEDRAIVLDNFFPSAAGIELRRGFWKHALTGKASAVETLMGYSAASPVADRLFAVCEDTIFDVTNRLVAPVAMVTGLHNARFQFVNMATDGGQFLWVCNGADAPRYYNGASWQAPGITGLTNPANIVNVAMHKRRLWFALVNSLDVAYLPVNSIAGAAKIYPMASLFSKGGYVMGIGSWSMDAGLGGQDDMLVVFTSRGQAAIFQGTDPDNASDFELLGVWDFSPPIGRRCILRVANDLALITQDGVIAITSATKTERAALASVALTKKIRTAMSEHARIYGRNFGWQLISHPVGSMAVLNVPLSEGTTAHQFVMNTVTGAWCRFTGQNASCWEVFQDGLYFGAPGGMVCRADVAAADFGAPLVADLRGAYTPMRRPGVEKTFSLIQPIFTTDGQLAPTLGIDTDYQGVAVLEGIAAAPNTSVAIWDTSNWDQADWSEDLTTYVSWAGISGVGKVGSIRMRLIVQPGTGSDYAAPSQFQVNGFNVIYEAGAIL